ncbi:hypothetical protein Pla123a_07860 [Posidoniimonas polymericola]|uniref:Mucoidy inhibitor MuiA family protein n=1 Tax=Posidoniimonas polymericola TaxID=2528002 RepID=A0A5C5ZFK2_9BACT|nr:mucoidy inhibitor MuiA family protein [Posidoniimonas polymericola]TWT85978.1 hypothetical protein Pla123a_07860 [Posidoniimonas polymericola]
MPARCLPALLVLLSAALPCLAAESTTTEGRVSAVTVYQGQALVTRQIELENAGGLTEIVVTGLPAKVQPGSLYAEPGDGVVVRSVRYRTRPVEQDVRAEVRELDQQLQDLQDKLAANARRRALLGERTEYLKQMEGFTTGTANAELKSGVLNAETLKSLTQFVFQERTEIAEQELTSQVEERELRQELELRQRKRNQLTQGSAKTVREAVVFADLGQPGAKQLSLTYIVTDATWSPSYNLRADAEAGRVTVEYNASIQQMSGEDWTDVDMTLSTATPSLVATAPRLDPLAIRLAAPTPEQQAASRDFAKAKSELMQQQRKLATLRNSYAADSPVFDGPMAGERLNDMFADHIQSESAPNAPATPGFAGGRGGGFGGMFAGSSVTADAGLNRISDEMQLLDFNGDLGRGRVAEQQPANSQGISVSYQLESSASLPSRSDRQLIQIASLPLEGRFYRLATPVLTEFVYKEAMLVNSTDMVLLAGPSATFLAGEFVGRGEVPTVAAGESLQVGLGIDTALRVSRELVEKKSRTQGGNRLVTFDYQLSLENFSGEEVDVRLMDRLPKPNSDEIKVTLVEPGKPLSEDQEYLKKQRKDGLLRWDLKVPAGAAGLDQQTIAYTIQLEYDKQLQIVGMPAK